MAAPEAVEVAEPAVLVTVGVTGAVAGDAVDVAGAAAGETVPATALMVFVTVPTVVMTARTAISTPHPHPRIATSRSR